MTTEPSDYVKHLPIGREIPFNADGIPGWEIFPFEGDLRVKKLEPPVLPEPPRNGAPGGTPCKPCTTPDSDYIWTDEHWRLRTFAEAALPALVMLEPREHHDLADLPAERTAELGALFQRVERAVLGLGGIERVHVARFGDGAEHLHWWFSARPEGMLQMRGSCLLIWEDVLPRVEAERWDETNRKIAAAMAADGGIAQI